MPKLVGPMFSLDARKMFGKTIVYEKYKNVNYAKLHKKAYDPRNSYQIALRERMAYGVYLWQNFTDAVKGYYNDLVHPENMSGYNRWLRMYMLAYVPVAPVEHVVTFDSGSGVWQVPTGVTELVIEAWGAGGGGGASGGGPSSSGKGAGSGAYVKKTVSVTPGDNLPYSVGVGGDGGLPTNPNTKGVNGTATTMSSFGISAGGGEAGASNADGGAGDGGIATGGDINTNGNAGGVGGSNLGGPGGDAPNGGTGGLGGASDHPGLPGNPPGAGGGGSGRDDQEEHWGGDGANGRLTITYLQ